MMTDQHRCIRPKGQRCPAVRCPTCGAFEHTRPSELPFDCLAHDLFRSYVEGTNCGPGLITQVNLMERGELASGHAAEAGDRGRSKPGSRPPTGYDVNASDLLADIHATRHPDLDKLQDWRRQARRLLKFSEKPKHFPDAHCPACLEHTMWASSDGAWCANSVGCHDSDRHPDCQLEQLPDGPRWSCRHTDRSLTHAHRWSAADLGWLFEQMAGVAS